MRVAVLSTGVMELGALHVSLQRLFHAHDFDAIPARPNSTVPFASFTSARLDLATQPGVSSSVDKLAAQTAALVTPRHGHASYDAVVVVDDVELCNAGQADVVVGVFRDALHRHLDRLADRGLAERVRDALREKASFHLAMPMVESWLFADPCGPRNAGVPSERLPPSWNDAVDPEAFTTDDPAYLSDDASCCATWLSLPADRQRKHRPLWLGEQRERHPKAFLSWLCREPTENKCSRYQETHGGATALRQLDWAAVLGRPKDQCLFLRSLVDDLAEILREPALRQQVKAPETSFAARRAPQTLRNI